MGQQIEVTVQRLRRFARALTQDTGSAVPPYEGRQR